MSVKVIKVSSQDEVRAFNSFPRNIYRNFYMAPIYPLAGGQGPREDPLFASVEAQPFLALRDGFLVGRITASAHQDVSDGFFGHLEIYNDTEVVKALLEGASRWLAARGKKQMTGPVDFTPHERLGLLLEGFGGSHLPGMPFNPPYYAPLLDGCGLVKETDLYSYYYNLHRPLPEKLGRVASRACRVKGMLLRGLNLNDLSREGKLFSEIHNGSMREIWGFAPLSPGEGAAILHRLKGFCETELILFTEISGQPAGLCLTVCPLKRAAFFPGQRDARLAVLAVLPQFRFKGLEAALLLELSRRARLKGLTGMEFSLVEENNSMMNRVIQSIEGVSRSRTYRVYKLPFI